MSAPGTAAFLELVAGRRGHFRLESGHHGGLWLDPHPLFAQPRRNAPVAPPPARAIPPDALWGVRGRRLAIVDDVMSAGSALRGTCAELVAHGAEPVVAGALLVLGDVGARV